MNVAVVSSFRVVPCGRDEVFDKMDDCRVTFVAADFAVAAVEAREVEAGLIKAVAHRWLTNEN